MKTIFINGLMPERSQVFLRHLARSFHIIGHGLGSLQNEPGLHISDPFSITRVFSSQEAQELKARIDEEVIVLEQQLTADIRAVAHGPAENWTLPDGDIRNSLLTRVSILLKQEQYFKALHAKQPIDMVISGADYGSHSRVTASTARQLGIPTLNLEHGFFFNQIRWVFSEVKGHMPMFFTSEFVNLDSMMEVELFEELLANFPDQGTTFLGLGTPVDTVAGQAISRDEACRQLGIDPQKTVVTLMGRWIEARSLNNLVRGQVDTINTFESLFATLAKSEFRHNVEVLIKLHPAEARPNVLPGIQACLENMADEYGLPAPRVFGDRLPEVLSAANLVASIGFSSVLYDAFQLGKPSIVLMPPFLIPSPHPDWRSRGNIPLAAGVMEVADDAADLWRRAVDWLTPERLKKLDGDVEKLTNKYQLQHNTVEEKSRNIVQWLQEYLNG